MEEKKISNLRARDPSILKCGPFLQTNQNGKETHDASSSTSIGDQLNEHIRVYLRLKKIYTCEELYEICDDRTLLCRAPQGARKKMTKTFKFSTIFGPDSNQREIFNSLVKRKVLSFINGSNCNLLTYGASGSGKTYTIVGNPEQPGLIPRALEYLFRTLPQLPELPLIKPTATGVVIQLSSIERQLEKNASHNLLNTIAFNNYRSQHMHTYKLMQQRLSNEPIAELLNDTTGVSLGVWVSFVEIYNEWIHDLLASDPPRGQPRRKLPLGYNSTDAYIKDITCIYVKSSLQAYQLLQYGMHKLKYAPTSLNDHSSRSHFIFTLKLVSSSFNNKKDNTTSVSTFNFYDLAGSERLKKTHNVGERLQESNKINNSLTTLGRCIDLIRKTKTSIKIIPFRESKLTQLLQKALLGYETISMIININPSRDMFDESQHVLNFSAIAKNVTVEQQEVIPAAFANYMENRSVSPIKSVGDSDDALLISELQKRAVELVEKIQETRLNAKEDREYVIKTYKGHLDQAHEYWQNRCRKLEDAISKNRQIAWKNLNAKINNCGVSNEEEGEIVIVLDSSTEENSNEFGDCSKRSFADEQRELLELKGKIHSRENTIKQLRADMGAITRKIEDAKEACRKLEMSYRVAGGELQDTLLQKKKMLENLTLQYENSSIWVGDDFEQTVI